MDRMPVPANEFPPLTTRERMLRDLAVDAQAEIEQLRAERDEYRAVNESVRVCADHVANVIDGPCLVCEAKRLLAEVAEWKQTAAAAQNAINLRQRDKEQAEAEAKRLRALLREAHEDPNANLTLSLDERIKEALA